MQTLMPSAIAYAVIISNFQSVQVFVCGMRSLNTAEIHYEGDDYKTRITNATRKAETLNQVLTSDEKLSFSQYSYGVDILLHSITSDNLAAMVGKMMWQTLDQRVPKCHNVLVTKDIGHPLIFYFMRYSFMSVKALVVVDMMALLQKDSRNLVNNLWGGLATSCRGLIVDVTFGAGDDLFETLEKSRLWLWSEVRVVIVGNHASAQSSLLQPALRNVPKPLYLGLEDETLKQLSSFVTTDWEKDAGDSSRIVSVYSRCLYCGKGQPNVRFLAYWKLGMEVPQDFTPFADQENNLDGHLLRATSMQLFPYNQYVLNTDEVASTVTQRDCLDKRMLEAFAAQMNFSYEVRAPRDSQWGMQTSGGNWTGMVGTVQYEIADFTTVISPNPGRIKIVDHARVYAADVMAIVSLKPQVLPRYLVIIRPFTINVWIYLVVSIFLLGLTLWFFQKLWTSFSKNRGMNLSTSIFYSWAVFLEDPPPRTPSNISGQMVVGWWLVACLVITTVYKSGLVANLTVVSRTPPIDTFEDLVEQENWKWAMRKVYFSGSPFAYMKGSSDPVVITIRENLQSVIDTKEALEKVATGHFSYLHFKSDVSTDLASYYTDNAGRSLYYVSKYGHKMLSDFGWGFRKGAPFSQKIKYLMNRLIDAGLIDFWTNTLMRDRVVQNRKEIQERKLDGDEKGIQMQQKLEEEESGVLRVSHLLGVFLFLVLGYSTSFLVLLGEVIAHRYHSS